MSGIDFQAARVKMVDGQLRTTDVTRHEVLAAFLEIPREQFVPGPLRDLAYLDDDIEVAPGRYLMEPSPLAKLIQLADVSVGDKVLIIGAGTGYGAAIMSRIASSVTAVEDNDQLVSVMAAQMKALAIGNVEIARAMPSNPEKEGAGFDVVLVEGSVGELPAALFGQMAEGGRLVVTEGQGHTGVARLYTKSGGKVSAVRGFNVSVKPLPGFAKKAGFAF